VPDSRTSSRLGIFAGASYGFRFGFSKHWSSSHDLTPGEATNRKCSDLGLGDRWVAG
jgi:hypothetical protein